MSILRRHRATPTGDISARQRLRTRRAIARAMSASPTEASRSELIALNARL